MNVVEQGVNGYVSPECVLERRAKCLERLSDEGNTWCNMRTYNFSWDTTVLSVFLTPQVNKVHLDA